MSYLLEAAQTLGIYYTPSHILAMGYGDGKTALDYIAGNPPFTTPKKRCPRCRGNGTIYETDGRPILCPECGGIGQVED